MSEENITTSDQYLKKTNRVILTIGLVSLFLFLVGVIVLSSGGDQIQENLDPQFTDNANVLDTGANASTDNAMDFGLTPDRGPPLTYTPSSVDLGQVLIGTEANAVITVGTNGKVSIEIVSVELAEPPSEGFNFDNKCKSELVLSGEATCNIAITWAPLTAKSIQNNFIVTWREKGFGAAQNKA